MEDDERRVGNYDDGVKFTADDVKNWFDNAPLLPVRELEWSPIKIERPKWEYYLLRYCDMAFMNDSTTQQLFDELGALGWELVLIEIVRKTHSGIEKRAVFKRIKE